jgi:two-component system response regulator (stage 0 sporulation protein F)
MVNTHIICNLQAFIGMQFGDIIGGTKRKSIMHKVYVLLVEDDKYMNLTLSGFLREEGYDIVSAGTAPEALNKIHENYKVYALVILDYNLGNLSGMTGLDVLKQMKISNPDVKSILITAYSDSKIKEMAKNAGVDVFINKPFMLDEILDAVAALTNDNSQKEPAVY